MRKNMLAIFVLLLIVPAIAPAQRSAVPAEHWVSTWATAVDLAPRPPFPRRPQTPDSEIPPEIKAALAAVPPPPNNAIPTTLDDQSIRMIVRSSIGGHKIRVEVSNAIGKDDITIGAAHIALRKQGSEIVPGSDGVLTFSGRPSYTIPQGGLIFSDPVDLDVPPLSDLAVSLYLPKDTGAPTAHMLGLHTGYISKGNTTGDAVIQQPTETYGYLWLTSVDVLAPANAFTIVAYGDSITDGYRTTRDANMDWPSLLAKRLDASPKNSRIAVINQGISGNSIYRGGAGSAIGRFDRDVLSRPGVQWMILLIGINDIDGMGQRPGPGSLVAADLIAGYHQLITRAHSYGIKVMGATLMPNEGLLIGNNYPTAQGEAMRVAVNEWIRTGREFDAVVDFDEATRDPQHPSRLRPDLDPGDRIHPNDKGNQVMADKIDTKVFQQ